MECDSFRLVIEPLCDGDYNITVKHIIRQVDERFTFSANVDEDGNLRIMIV